MFMLKKSICLTVLLAFFLSEAGAQNLKEIKQDIYYTRFETAKSALQKMIGSGTPDPEAYYLLGEIYLRQKNEDAAKKIVQMGLEYVTTKDISMKKAPLVHIARAHLLLNEGKNAEARSLLDEVLRAGKYKDADALYAAGRVQVDSRNGDLNYALELLNEAAKRDKNNPFIYTAMADGYRKAIDGTHAVQYYGYALNADPSFAEAVYKEGKIYKTQKNPEVYLAKFMQAYQMDSAYVPALYELYYHYFYTDVVEAKKYFDVYVRHADPSVERDYMLTDLMYVSQRYQEAIAGAEKILQTEKEDAQPRLYKLIAYSQASLGDSAAALENMNRYFEKQPDSEIVAKDYVLEAKLLQSAAGGNRDAALDWFAKALSREKDPKEKVDLLIELADLQKELGRVHEEAETREQLYLVKEKPTNLDIYKWGMALFNDENYAKADSVFGIYGQQYPDQVYGPLWQAKCNALIDTSMALGLAVPHYKKLIEVASAAPDKNKSLLLRAYNYLGVYEANITKNYKAALEDFEAILTIEPDNADAQKFTGVLKGWIEKAKNEQGDGNSEGTRKTNTAAVPETGQ